MTQKIYCVAYEIISHTPRGGTKVTAHTEYMKADDAGHARNSFCFMHPNRTTHRVVAVAPALGFYINDEKKEKELTVE